MSGPMPILICPTQLEDLARANKFASWYRTHTDADFPVFSSFEKPQNLLLGRMTDDRKLQVRLASAARSLGSTDAGVARKAWVHPVTRIIVEFPLRAILQRSDYCQPEPSMRCTSARALMIISSLRMDSVHAAAEHAAPSLMRPASETLHNGPPGPTNDTSPLQTRRDSHLRAEVAR